MPALVNGDCLVFDGTTGFLTAPALQLFAVTFEAWVNPTAYGTDARFFDSSSGANNADCISVGFAGANTYLSVRTSSGAAVNMVNCVVPLNAWTHVAVTIDAASAKGYVNGVLKDTVTVTAPTNKTRAQTLLGKSSYTATTALFSGSMAGVRVWNRARALGEIASQMFLSFDTGEAWALSLCLSQAALTTLSGGSLTATPGGATAVSGGVTRSVGTGPQTITPRRPWGPSPTPPVPARADRPWRSRPGSTSTCRTRRTSIGPAVGS